jgi:single-stranded-DNA-specific exonuclease
MMDSGSAARETWGIGVRADHSRFESPQEIQNYLHCHPVVSRILWNRGIRSVQLVEALANPDLSKLPDPMSITDMGKAVARVADAVVAQQDKIAIYGDYDVDGTCGTSILFDFFRALGIEVTCYQPNRFSEGYGVHSAAIAKLIDDGHTLIITVDCGITAIEPAQVAKAKGADLIIIDHHKLGASLPEAFAVIDPQRPDCESGLLNVCGSGLAFFFALALRAELRARGYFASRTEPNMMRLLDLVAVATVADVVDLRGVNRILVTHGLRVMTKTPRVGIKAMLEAANILKPTAMHCGFVLGPRINAAGRLYSARAALDLLTSTDIEAARALAREIETINTARRQTQDEVLTQARAAAAAQVADPRWAELAKEIPGAQLGPWPRALVLVAPDGTNSWHEGVVGIVASKIVEEFGRPTFILATKENHSKEPVATEQEEVLKGSVRSISKIDILSVISAGSVAAHLLNFGGHAHAGGVTLKRSALQTFREALNLHLAITTSEEQYSRERHFDAEVKLGEIDAQLIEELLKLEPFGHKFPEPILKLDGVSAMQVKVMKEKHLKIRVIDEQASAPRVGIDAVWFNVLRENEALIEVAKLEDGGQCSLWVSPQWNEWQGVKRPQLHVRHGELVSKQQA